MGRPRLAIVVPYLPAPAVSGGRIRAFELARRLKSWADLYLYTFSQEPVPSRRSPELKIYERARVWPRSFGARSLMSLGRLLAKDHARLRFTGMVAMHCDAAGLLNFAPDLPLVVDEHNVESIATREQQRARGRVWPARIRGMRRYERLVWASASLVTCVKAEDQRHIRKHTRWVELVPNGAPVRDIPFVRPSRRRGQQVLFVGAMNYSPNVAAALFLARQVLPRLRLEYPELQLVLCGGRPTKRLLRLAGPGVEVTGQVADVRPFLQRARVVAMPLHHGAGSSLKFVEALAAGVPVVSSRLGARGFGARPGHHYSAAESPAQFVEAIKQVLSATGPSLQRLDARALRGRRLALEFDWVRIGRKYQGLVRRALRPPTS